MSDRVGKSNCFGAYIKVINAVQTAIHCHTKSHIVPCKLPYTAIRNAVQCHTNAIQHFFHFCFNQSHQKGQWNQTKSTALFIRFTKPYSSFLLSFVIVTGRLSIFNLSALTKVGATHLRIVSFLPTPT